MLILKYTHKHIAEKGRAVCGVRSPPTYTLVVSKRRDLMAFAKIRKVGNLPTFGGFCIYMTYGTFTFRRREYLLRLLPVITGFLKRAPQVS